MRYGSIFVLWIELSGERFELASGQFHKFVRRTMNTKRLDEFVESNPRKMGGTAVFRGTRVPIQNLFDYLEGGDSLDMFLDDFPTVTREQVIGVLESFKIELLADYEIAA